MTFACPGAPSMIGSCQATPGFLQACGMSSMSDPSAITGLPESPRRHERSRDAGDTVLHAEPVCFMDRCEVLRRLEFLESRFGET